MAARTRSFAAREVIGVGAVARCCRISIRGNDTTNSPSSYAACNNRTSDCKFVSISTGWSSSNFVCDGDAGVMRTCCYGTAHRVGVCRFVQSEK